MSPTRAKVLRRYAQLHATLGNPLRATTRQLKASMAGVSAKHRGKLYRRAAQLTRQPFSLTADGATAVLYMAGLSVERHNLIRARNIEERAGRRPEKGPWLLQLSIPVSTLSALGLPIVCYVLPLG